MSVASLAIVGRYIIYYGMSILLIFGCIGNTFVILLFHRRRKTAFSIYISCAASINIIYLTFNIPIYIYTYLHTDPTSNSLFFCKLRNYLSHILGQMARYFIILACFDRYLITNIDHYRGYFNRLITAKYLVLFVTMFWCLIGSHQLIFIIIRNQQCVQLGIYFIINHIYLIISASIIPPVLMLIFGSLAYHQVKRLYNRIRPVVNHINAFSIHRRDREFLIMILIEVFIYVLTMMPYLMINIEFLITYSINENKTIEHIQIENFILIVSVFLIYMNHAVPFYIYTLVSKRFRRDLKILFREYCQ